MSRTLVEGNGLQGDRNAIKRLTDANEAIIGLIKRVATTQDLHSNSALGCSLNRIHQYLPHIRDRFDAEGSKELVCE
jgi:hypothetical protein